MATTHVDLSRLGQKARVKPAVVWLLITLFYRKKHFFILNDNKDKKHIITLWMFEKLCHVRDVSVFEKLRF